MESRSRIRTPLGQRLVLRGSLQLFLWLGAATLCGWLLLRRSERSVFYGLVRSHQVEISPLVPGRIEDVLVDLYESVEAGQCIALLDPERLEARIETARGLGMQLRAQLEATRSEMEASERAASLEHVAEARRFTTDVEDLRLDSLQLMVEIEADRVERDRLDINFKRAESLARGGVDSRAAAEDARLARDEVEVRIRRNEALLAEMRTTLGQAELRRSAFAGEPPAPESVAAALAAIREEIHVEELRLQELQIERQALILSSPVHGIIQQLPCAQGQTVLPGEAVAVVVAPMPGEVVVYVPETSSVELAPGDRLQVRTQRSPWMSAECVVVAVAGAVELLPLQLWRDRTLPEYGFPVLARGAQRLVLRPGEKVSVSVSARLREGI